MLLGTRRRLVVTSIVMGIVPAEEFVAMVLIQIGIILPYLTPVKSMMITLNTSHASRQLM